MAKAKSTEAKDTKVEKVEKVEEKTEKTEEVVVTRDVFEKMFAEAEKAALAKLEERFAALEKLEEQFKEQETAKKNEHKDEHPEGYVPETEEQKAWAEERVEVIAPLDAQEPDDIPLTVNGRTIVIKRGHRVMIPRKYALVLESSIEQQMASKRFQDELQKPENQVTYVD